MAQDERKRQKKLERKKAKRREALTQPGRASLDWPNDPETQSKLPMYDCQVSSQLFDSGIGQAVVARSMSSGHLGVGVFLLDVYCLGIKNAYFRSMPVGEYRELLRRMKQSSPMEPRDPAYAKKLIEESAAWARGIGFVPHADFEVARRVLAGVDAHACQEQFVFGKEGKPYYMSGPYDRPFRINQIMQTLLRTCGQGNFDYTVGVDSMSPKLVESED